MKFKKLFKDKEGLELISGRISSNLFYLSLPIVIINLLRIAYNFIDTFWLGQLSKEALAAITFAFPIIFLIISLGIGIVVAGTVLIAQYEGGKNRDMVDFAASQTVTFSFLASILFSIIGYYSVEHILRFMGAAPEVLILAKNYLQIISLGIFSMFGFNVFIALLRGYGETVKPMKLMLGSVILNIILDPFLIFGWSIFPELGIQGAAIATVFTRGLALITGLYILFTGREGITISLSNMKPDIQFFRKILKIGIPASAEGVGSAVSINALMVVVGGFPTAVVAGFGIGIRIFSVIFRPAMAIGKGTETMTGQNLGAEKFDRVGKINYTAAKFTFGLFSFIGILLFIAPGPIVSIFSNDPKVINHGNQFVRYMAPTFGFIATTHIFKGGLRGAGKTIEAAAISIFILGVLRFGFALTGSTLLGVIGIWLSFPISNILGGLTSYYWFRKGSWRQKIV